MILMAGMDLPLVIVREHIAASIDVVVQQVRLADGRRLITSVVEIVGMESGRIQLQELFRYESGPPQAFAGCGVIPEFFSACTDVSQRLGVAVFNQRTVLARQDGSGGYARGEEIGKGDCGEKR